MLDDVVRTRYISCARNISRARLACSFAGCVVSRTISKLLGVK